MGKYIVDFEDVACKDLKDHYKSENQSTIKKIEKILLELTENPFLGERQPEGLKYNFKGYWSRRINKKKQNGLSSRNEYSYLICGFCNGAFIRINNYEDT
ncbi:type II toxin-antitoxin system YoeB family toxin [Flavobacterium ovatum]|uniref:type II toxin-antitoxin system YoeB family toxin n=1 Tax=Flavobacterium ovatum TaxID=1928857 RepID=UPI00344F7DDA